MLDKHHLDYFNLGKKENEKFWRRLDEKPNFKGKTVLDFGCGHGALAIEIAKQGAKKVVGIDLEKDYVRFANENLEINYPSLKSIVEFHNIDLLKNDNFDKFDFIVSKDTFEHTQDLNSVMTRFYNLLNQNGKVYLGFGPLYNFYNGDHGRTKSYLPWFHLIIPEKLNIKRHNLKNKRKINKIEDLGLSKYSYKQYVNLFKNSEFKVSYFKINLSDHPIAFIFNILRKIKFLSEFFTFNIYCILVK